MDLDLDLDLSPRTRLVATLALLALVATGSPLPEPVSPDDLAPARADEVRQVSAPAAPPAQVEPETTGWSPDALPAPVPDPDPVPLPATVQTRQPDVVVSEVSRTDAAAVAAGVEGVEHAVGVAMFDTLLVTAPGTGHPVRAMAVNPAAFRPLTPRVTADSVGVWERLRDGEIVIRHDVAHRLRLDLGGSYELHGPVGRVGARVGAFASNGAPPFADVLVPWSVAERIGVTTVNTVITAVGEAPSTVADEISAALGEGEVSVRTAPEAQEAHLDGGGQATQLEPFEYTDLGDGMIAIDPGWVQRWIVSVDLPHLGRTRCHRVMVPQVLAALHEIETLGLAGHFKPEQFAGCWVPRHIDWRPDKPLSMHAWGLAIDINAQDNWLGQTPTMDPRIVAVFEKWGFEWGGRWSRPDGMHFELDRIVQVP